MNRVWPLLLLALPCYSQMIQAQTVSASDTSIRPFRVHVPERVLRRAKVRSERSCRIVWPGPYRSRPSLAAAARLAWS